MQTDLKSGLYVCPVCEEVFDLQGELPICETCLCLLDGCSLGDGTPESPVPLCGA